MGCCADADCAEQPVTDVGCIDPLELEERKDDPQMIEDVEMRSLFDNREERDASHPDDEELRDPYDGRLAGDHADDEVVKEDEREKEGDALQNGGLEWKDTPDVDENGAERSEDDQSDRSIERTATQSSLRIDEQRAHPGSQNERYGEAVELQPER